MLCENQYYIGLKYKVIVYFNLYYFILFLRNPYYIYVSTVYQIIYSI
jgi:hypothetical protein